MMVWYLTLWVQLYSTSATFGPYLIVYQMVLKEVLLTYLMETIIIVFLLLFPNCIKLKAEILNLFTDPVVNLTQEKMRLKD